MPNDPDRSAARIHRELKKALHLSIPVIITDTFGRPWREGLTEVAIGVAGMPPHDYRGLPDSHGYKLQASIEADADQLACAAGLVCRRALARTPACIIRGAAYRPGRGSARDLIRPAASDLFR